MELNLDGRKALITGGSRGIGWACARALAAEGVNLAIAARTVGPLKEATLELRREFGVEVSSHSCDLTKRTHREALVEVAGQVDILVNNAGDIPAGSVLEVDDEALRRSWELKVFGYIDLVRRFLPSMTARGSGVIVNVIGAAADHPRSNYVAGSAANAALAAFTKAEGAQSYLNGVRIVGINPGLTRTDRLEELLRQQAETSLGDGERWEELVPKDPEPADPEDVANVVVFACSDRARLLSGATVTLDGGAGFLS